jgi:hypothetical protein
MSAVESQVETTYDPSYTTTIAFISFHLTLSFGERGGEQQQHLGWSGGGAGRCRPSVSHARRATTCSRGSARTLSACREGRAPSSRARGLRRCAAKRSTCPRHARRGTKRLRGLRRRLMSRCGLRRLRSVWLCETPSRCMRLRSVCLCETPSRCMRYLAQKLLATRPWSSSQQTRTAASQHATTTRKHSECLSRLLQSLRRRSLAQAAVAPHCGCL